MGWLRLDVCTTREETPFEAAQDDLKYKTQHIESISTSPDTPRPCTHPRVSLSLPDNELPFIPRCEVINRKSAASGGICMLDPVCLYSVSDYVLVIIIDGIVYDCTEFIKIHPGGFQFIDSFAGSECSWQFWRFHGKAEMEKFGKPLRVGRTKDLVNKFKEPKKYVGLRRLDDN